MEFDWYFRLPDFQNREEWVEIGLLDFYFDAKTMSVREDCKYGCAHEDLVIGMIIVKKSVSNLSLLLMEYRDPKGKGPVALKWSEITDKDKYGAALKSAKGWSVMAKDQVFIWRVAYNKKERRVASATAFLKSVDLPPSN